VTHALWLGLALALASADEPLLREVAPGVHAALQPAARRFDDANVTVFVGERAWLVVDAPTDPARVREIADEIRRRGFDRPVRYLVDTHWHGDHTQGNAVLRDAFAGELVIVGHRTLREDVPGRAAAALREQVAGLEPEIVAAEDRLRRGVKRDGSALSEAELPLAREAIDRARGFVERNREARFEPPDLSVDDRLELDLGGLAIELVHVVAHTRGDLVVWSPDRRVLAAGDVVDDLPYVGHGYPRRWVAALDRLGALSPAVVVPGHGPVFVGTEQIERVRGFLSALGDAAESARAAGGDLAAMAAAFPGAHWREELARDDAAERFYDAVLEEALARAWGEERLLEEERAEGRAEEDDRR
jgi:glyoxylase-like metal-dependent hydrolase (beta-lactamase superfamily II)